jgi:hypothetical protein
MGSVKVKWGMAISRSRGAAALGCVLTVSDYGLMDAAVARPRSTVFGIDAYPD